MEEVDRLLTELNQCQINYLQLKEFKKKVSISELAACLQKANPYDNVLIDIIEVNKNLWLTLMEALDNAYLDHIYNYMLDKVNGILSQLGNSLEKEWNLFRTLINKKKE